MKPQNLIVLLFFVICVGLSRQTQAVVPPPDGGYPNFTTAEGTNALKNLTTGAANTAVGWFSLFGDTTASFNTSVGAATLLFNNGNQNTAVGVAALLNNTTGNGNIANGYQALYSNTTGNLNVANGVLALFSHTTGDGNTAMGLQALQNNTTGSTNTALGFGAGSAVTTANNVIAISAPGENVSDTCYIGNIFGVTSAGATAVYVNADGKLGTVVSSRRFKDEVKPMDIASEAILALQPVTFRYKQEIDPTHSPQFGLVAEDVEKVNPDLVVRDAEGKVNTVRYDAVNAMLLNEFLKEHKTVQEQGATITQQRKDFEAALAQQQKQIETLTATVKEQASQIQKVSEQLELGKSTPRTVVSNQ